MRPTDAWLFEPPEFPSDWGWILEGFQEVSTDRHLGFGGSGPVPFSSIDLYAEREGMTGEEYRLFRRLVRELDAEYMDFQAERSRA